MSLQSMTEEGLISQDWNEKCQSFKWKSKWKWSGCCLPYYVWWHRVLKKMGVFLHIYKPTGADLVTFDHVSGKWNCQCRGTGQTHRCVHCMLVMWIYPPKSAFTKHRHTDNRHRRLGDRYPFGRNGNVVICQQWLDSFKNNRLSL